VIEVADKELGCETGWNTQVSAVTNHAAVSDGWHRRRYDGNVEHVFVPIVSTTTTAALASTIPAFGVTKTIIQRLFPLQWWPLGLVRAMTYAPSTTWQQVPSQLCVSEH
jgi:hypothetical protein